MKTSFLTLFAAAFLAVSASYAGAPAGPMGPPPAPAASNGGLFIGVDSGAFWLQDSTVSGGGVSADLKYKTGWGITVPVGYDFGNGFSLFLSGGYDRADVDSLSVNAFDAAPARDFRCGRPVHPDHGECFLRPETGDNFSWYFGAGLGTVAEKASAAGFDSHWDWEFGFQAFTGFAYHCSQNCSINLGYRFLYVNDGSSIDGFDANSSKGHTLELGVTFSNSNPARAGFSDRQAGKPACRFVVGGSGRAGGSMTYRSNRTYTTYVMAADVPMRPTEKAPPA